ncbi:MAG TPA: hypothetical protein VHV99_23985, partial [Paraburkholderia sp.]|nr:hypothetical protein [Paraburkholderia sp.]
VFGKRAPAVTRPIEQKESIKWLEGIDHLAALKVRCAQTRFVCVGDRESDLYELFSAERCELSPLRSQTVFGIKAPGTFRRLGATSLSAYRRQ